MGDNVSRKVKPSRSETAPDRFLSKVNHVDAGHVTPCWEWTGCLDYDGYAKFNPDGKIIRAYRWAYTFYVGQIPEGLVLDHVCRNRPCVNPEHLEPVTAIENTRRGKEARRRAKESKQLTLILA
jgi:hypothetical protein